MTQQYANPCERRIKPFGASSFDLGASVAFPSGCVTELPGHNAAHHNLHDQRAATTREQVQA